MTNAERSARRARRSRRRTHPGALAGARRAFAALDLGTNNCRLLIAEPTRLGFRVVDGYSEIVRLGDGLARTGELAPAAMDRAMGALKVCAGKIARWPIASMRCIATQACRVAANGEAFLARVKGETGLRFSVITPSEEAELSVLGCAALMEPDAGMALVVDIGGGSTELSWVSGGAEAPKILEWTSLPFGVVTLADRHGDAAEQEHGFSAMVEEVAGAIRAFTAAERLRTHFDSARAHYLGTSGTVTSLAGVHLRLPRYQRAKVDGLWMDVGETRAAVAELRGVDRAARARNPCIGPERADLVIPGAAILEAIFQTWPAPRIRVADRGLREGVLIRLMAEARTPNGR